MLSLLERSRLANKIEEFIILHEYTFTLNKFTFFSGFNFTKDYTIWVSLDNGKLALIDLKKGFQRPAIIEIGHYNSYITCIANPSKNSLYISDSKVFEHIQTKNKNSFN